MIIKKIDSIIRFFIYSLFFWLPFSSAAVEICVIIALILFIIKRILLIDWKYSHSDFMNVFKYFLKSIGPKDTLLNKPIGVFILICIVSILNSYYPKQAFEGFLTKTAEWFVIYFLIVEVISKRKHFMIVCWIMIICTVILSLDSLVQFYVTGKDLFNSRVIVRGGATATFKHPNSLGAYLIIVIPFVFSLILSNNFKRYRPLLILYFLIALWSLFTTFSRAAWFVTILALMIFLFLMRKEFMALLLAVAMAVLIFVCAFFPMDLKYQWRLNTANIEETIEWRIGLWEDSLKMIKEKPILGHGLNTFMRLFQKYRRKFEVYNAYEPTYAHNCYLQIVAEVGILGLVSFLWIIGRFLRKSFHVFYSKAKEDLKVAHLGLFSGVLAFLIHSFFDVNFYSLQLSALLWSSIGILVCFYRLLSESTSYNIKTA